MCINFRWSANESYIYYCTPTAGEQTSFLTVHEVNQNQYTNQKEPSSIVTILLPLSSNACQSILRAIAHAVCRLSQSLSGTRDSVSKSLGGSADGVSESFGRATNSLSKATNNVTDSVCEATNGIA